MCCELQPLKTEVFNFPWCSRSWRFGQESSTGDNRHQHTLSVHVCSSVCKLTPFIARNATMAQVGTILRSKLASAYMLGVPDYSICAAICVLIPRQELLASLRP